MIICSRKVASQVLPNSSIEVALRFSDASVSTLKLPDGKGELLVFDENLAGFGVRIRAGGKRTWVVQYRIGANQRRLSLGSTQSIDAAEARRRAKSALAQVQLGQDPQAEKLAARTPKAKEITVGELVERYLLFAEKRLKASTYSGVVLHLRRHWQPLHMQELPTLQRRHVAAELGRIARDSGPYGANRSRAALSALFSWAIGEGYTDINPVIGTNKATEEVARDRVLGDQELAAVWQCAGDRDYGRIVRLLILTGQRREEVGGLLWSEVDPAQAAWTIGAKRTKNRLAHAVPLSTAALDILDGQPKQEERDLVFGSREGPFSGWSNAKSALDERIKEQLGETLPMWRLHDLRRTVATRLGDIGVLPHVVEAVLNHVSGSRAGVAGVYNRAIYATEKRAALDLWAKHVAQIVRS